MAPIAAPALQLDVLYRDEGFVVATKEEHRPLTPRVFPAEIDPFAAILQRAKQASDSTSEPVQIAKGIYFGPTVVASAGNITPATPSPQPPTSTTNPATVTAAPCQPGFSLPARDRYTVCFVLEKSDLPEKDRTALMEVAREGNDIRIEANAFGNQPGHDRLANERGRAVKDALLAGGAQERNITIVAQAGDSCVTNCPQYVVVTYQPNK